jgi:cell division protein ZapA (FtsZ GTPase activity inhibitor)
MPTEVSIFDKMYKFECAANEVQNIQAAAEVVDKKYRETRMAMPRLETDRIGTMVAFNLALEYAKLEHQFKVFADEMTQEKHQARQIIQQLTKDVEAALATD